MRWKVSQFAAPSAVFCISQSAYQPLSPPSGTTVIIESECSAGAAATSSTPPPPAVQEVGDRPPAARVGVVARREQDPDPVLPGDLRGRHGDGEVAGAVHLGGAGQHGQALAVGEGRDGGGDGGGRGGGGRGDGGTGRGGTGQDGEQHRRAGGEAGGHRGGHRGTLRREGPRGGVARGGPVVPILVAARVRWTGHATGHR
ncbi:hypothetical protein GCM10020229_32720 [Kitasatospora albolonga]